MGFGIVVHSDDTVLRQLDADAAGAALMSVLGTQSYPQVFTPSAAGPWTSVGAWHATGRPVPLSLSAEAVTVGDGPDSPAAWHPALTPSDHMRAVRDLRSAAGVQKLARAGGDSTVAAFGPDVPTLASIWWVYADGLHAGIDEAAVGAAALQLLADRARSSAGIGSYGNMLNRLGGITGNDTTVAVVWSGNRLCRPDGLTEQEKAALTSER